MESNPVSRVPGPSRRVFLSASAAAAVAAPVAVASAAPASAAAAVRAQAGLPARAPSADLRALLSEVDPDRIHATVLRLTQFGTRHTASQPDRPGARHRRRHGLGLRAAAGLRGRRPAAG